MSYDMIRRDGLLEFARNHIDGKIDCNDIARFPYANAEPVRHGVWLPTSDENKKRCSRCDVIHLIAQYPHGEANYCPNCGAKMDGDADVPES